MTKMNLMNKCAPAVLLIALSAQGMAADSSKVEALEARVAQLEKRLHQLIETQKTQSKKLRLSL